MSSYLITGTSRGIGLELVKQLREQPPSRVSVIFAVTRTHSNSLQELIDASSGRIINIIIDNLSNQASVRKSVEHIEATLDGKGLDILINNAGIAPFSPSAAVQTLPPDAMRDALEVNVIGTHVLTAAFLPLLERGIEKKIINISTPVGSIGFAENFKVTFGPAHAYKISKAGLNMLTVQYALTLEESGFTVMALSPGWLKTDMGSQDADLDVGVGVASVVDVVQTADSSKNGKFFNIRVPGWEHARFPYDGGEIAW